MPYALDARLARRPLPPPFDAALGASGKARVLGVLDPERYITRGGGGGGGGGAQLGAARALDGATGGLRFGG